MALVVADKFSRPPKLSETEVAENTMPAGEQKVEVYGPPAPSAPPPITGSIVKPKTRKGVAEKVVVEKVDPLMQTIRNVCAWFERGFSSDNDTGTAKR